MLSHVCRLPDPYISLPLLIQQFKLPRAGDALLLVDCVYNFVAMFVCHFVSLERGDNTLQNRREVDLVSCQKFTTWQNPTMEQDLGFSVPINNHCFGVFYA